jgi:hypothetical protein
LAVATPQTISALNIEPTKKTKKDRKSKEEERRGRVKICLTNRDAFSIEPADISRFDPICDRTNKNN